MDFSDKFKRIWWIVILIILSILLILINRSCISNLDKNVFIIVLIIWIVLLLFPLFSEFDILGFKLKKEIEKIKNDFSGQINDVRMEIKTNNNQNIYLGYGIPAPDSKIPELEQKVKRLEEIFTNSHSNNSKTSNSETESIPKDIKSFKGRFDLPDTTTKLFAIRLNIEKIINKLWEENIDIPSNERGKLISPTKMLVDLDRASIINNDLFGVIKQMLSICNYAVHGKDISKVQIDFVIKNAKLVYDYLNDLVEKEIDYDGDLQIM